MRKPVDPNALFADIGNPPTSLPTPADGETAAKALVVAVDRKGRIVEDALATQQSVITDTATKTAAQIRAVQGDYTVFELNQVLQGWFPEDSGRAMQLISQRSRTVLNVDSAADYGLVPDNVVRQFVTSAATRETGEARMKVAESLDFATGVSQSIANDKDISSERVTQKAKQLIEKWKDAEALARLFGKLFTKTLNRVVDYQARLESVGVDLAKKMVLLEKVSSSLQTRQQLVLATLFDTCISGLALENILTQQLQDLEDIKANEKGLRREVLAQRITETEALIEITRKRLIDLKAFALKLIALYSILGNTRLNVAIVKADVNFARTNLIATLGLQLGLVVDIISTLRVAHAAQNVRAAEADASEKVGVASSALDEAANKALLDVETTLRSLRSTLTAAINGIANTHANMERVDTMFKDTDRNLAQMFSQMA